MNPCRTLLQTMLIALAITAAMPALALDIQRDVLLTDDEGGTLSLITSGTIDVAGGETVTTARFTDFTALASRRTVNGEVVRTRSRGVEEVESVYEGVLDIAVERDDGEIRNLSIAFEGLTVIRSGDGPQLSGTVIFDGNVVDAADAPARLLGLVKRSLRFFRLA
ncbi:MAG: hypothetical protein R3323_00760 [Wenzhouxiangellaceae bacterium]|nr:hypothetical protein [Wenzhouxiangellaceae bacterium]